MKKTYGSDDFIGIFYITYKEIIHKLFKNTIKDGPNTKQRYHKNETNILHWIVKKAHIKLVTNGNQQYIRKEYLQRLLWGAGIRCLFFACSTPRFDSKNHTLQE